MCLGYECVLGLVCWAMSVCVFGLVVWAMSVCGVVCFSSGCPSGDDMNLAAIIAHLASSPRMKLSFSVGLRMLNWGNI